MNPGEERYLHLYVLIGVLGLVVDADSVFLYERRFAGKRQPA